MQQRGQQSGKHGDEETRLWQQGHDAWTEPAEYRRSAATAPARRSPGRSVVLIAAGVVTALAAGTIALAATHHSRKSPNAAVQPSVTASSSAPGDPAPVADASALYSATVPTVSDGSSTVQINHRAVTFPSTVTDAVWSPNGTRLAYIDGDGNVAVANPDGTGVHVLTVKKAGYTRAHPGWNGDTLTWAVRKGTRWYLGRAAADAAPALETGVQSWASDGSDTQDNAGYSASSGGDPLGTAVDAVEAFRIGSGILESAYIDRYLDPDSNGYGGYPWSGVAQGSDPAVTADGRVVYVGANGQLWVGGQSTGFDRKAFQITFGINHPSHPAWSPDGSRVAFETAVDVESVAVPMQAVTSSQPRQEYPKPGVPTYQNVAGAPAVLGFDGADPTAATLAVSQAKWLDYRTALGSGRGIAAAAGAVVVTAGSAPAVLEEAAALAANEGLAFYVTPDGQLAPSVLVELRRLFNVHDKRTFPVVLLGSVPAGAEADITTVSGQKPLRVSTTDPYRIPLLGRSALAAARNAARGVQDAAPPSLDGTVYLVADDDRASLVAALGVTATQTYGYGGTVLLTDGAKLPEALKATLTAAALQNAKLVLVGAHAQQAWSGWSGHGSVKTHPVSGTTPAALAVSLSRPQIEETGDGVSLVLRSAAVLPVPTSQNLVPELALAVSGGETVFFADPAAGPDAATTAVLAGMTPALLHVDTLGDPAALATALTAALKTPVPIATITDPKAAR